MIWGLVLLSCAVCLQGQEYPGRPEYYRPPVRPDVYRPLVDETPKPYAFQYEAPAIGGSSSRSESADGSGRVVGSYVVTDEDGRHRVVEYSADQNGFTAVVQTNEPGTKSESPADIVFNSAAPPPTYDTAPVRAGPTDYRRVPASPTGYRDPYLHHVPYAHNYLGRAPYS